MAAFNNPFAFEFVGIKWARSATICLIQTEIDDNVSIWVYDGCEQTLRDALLNHCKSIGGDFWHEQ